MLLSLLDLRNPEFTPKRWAELFALADGGEKFHALIETFLPRNFNEPPDLYLERASKAAFHSYSGSVTNLYVSWIFAAEFSVKAYQKDATEPMEDLDGFYSRFSENVGDEITLSKFIRERFREAMITSRSYWLCELPSNEGEAPITKANYEARELGHARLTPLSQDELIDWDRDSEDALAWALTHTMTESRPSIMAPRGLVTEVWKYYDKKEVVTFTLQWERDEGRPAAESTDVLETERAPHGFLRVPIVELEIPKYLCIGEQIRDAQLEYFRMDAGLSWAIHRTCYALPILKQSDDEDLPVIGVGYMLRLGPEDSFEWAAPPSESFEVIKRARDGKRDELYRIVHQIQSGLDSNAETAGRSAASKEIDSSATRIMLNAFGGYISQAIEETYEMISEARAEQGFEWSVEGFSGYDVSTAGSLLDNTLIAKGLGIPSQTFMREITTKAALALLPEVNERIKNQIRTEITEHEFTVTGETEKVAIADTVAETAAAAAEVAAKAKSDSGKPPVPASRAGKAKVAKP